MPWPEQLPSGKWRACWRDEHGRQRSKSGFTREELAKRYAGEQESRARRGELTADGRAPKWDDWRDTWLARRRVEPSTAQQDQIRIDRYLTPHWSGIRLNKIAREDVQEWVNDLAVTPRHDGRKNRDDEEEPAVLAPATVERIYRLFSASMKAAVDDRRIPLTVNPCKGVKVDEAAPGHERYLTWAEFWLIHHHLNEPYRTMAAVLVGSGMRFGELAGLHWQRVDLAAGMIDVVETWDPASRTIKPYPKGKGKSRRSVPIPAWLTPVLEEQLDRAGPPAAQCGLKHRSGARCRSGLVVRAPEGGALDGHNVGRRDWATACDDSGVGHVRLHDLRHTYASWLVQAGVSLQEVQRLLGHRSITTTQRYAHLGSSQHGRVLAALDQSIPTFT